MSQKRIETRSWSTSYRGDLAIHASKGFPHACRELCAQTPFAAALAPGGSASWQYLPLGRIVAVARLVGVLPTAAIRNASFMECDIRLTALPGVFLGDPEPETAATAARWTLTDTELAFGDYAPGRFAWLLADVRPVTPIPCTGALGLWTVPDSITHQITEELAA